MELEHQNAVTGGLPGPAVPVPAKPRRIYEADFRERLLLALTLALGVLLADLFLCQSYAYAGLGLTLLVLAWEAVLFWYAPRPGKGLTRPAILLTAAVVLLALTFTIWSNSWFWSVNFLALPCLMGVQMLECFGDARRPWHDPLMLAERAGHVLAGLFGSLGAPGKALESLGKPGTHKRTGYVLWTLILLLPLLGVVLFLLSSADALFDLLAGRAINFVVDHFGSLLGRLFLGAVAAPFLFSLCYTLRRGRDVLGKPAAGEEKAPWRADPAIPVTAVAVLDLVYLLFVGVQFYALFGGRAYLEQTGLTYAEYARSGFFQLVWVSCINLCVVVAAVHFCRREGKLWQALRLLSSGLVALSGVMLVSACRRMSLYVGEYGLSFKRALTYWGMAMLLIFFAGAALKIWKRDFGFFRVLFAAGLAGWLVLNFANVDAIVARYNVRAYQTGALEWLDVRYLARLSCAVVPALETLPPEMEVIPGVPQYTVSEVLDDLRTSAAYQTARWETWTLTAFLAS